MHRPHLRLPATLQATNINPNCGYDSFVFSGQVFLCLVATIGAAYFVVRGFIRPALHDRDRLWCERWTGLAFGVIAIAFGSVLISILEKKGTIIIAAHWVASCILWLLF